MPRTVPVVSCLDKGALLAAFVVVSIVLGMLLGNWIRRGKGPPDDR